MNTTCTFKIGNKVSFGRPNGEQTLGTIVKVNPSKLKIRQDEARGTLRVRPEGTIWTVPPNLCRLVSVGEFKAVPAAPKAKRPDAAILADIVSIYGALSPENLHCDGEISRSAAARKAVALRAQLYTLFAEIGRQVSEDEAYRLTARTNARDDPPVAPWKSANFNRTPDKQVGFQVGDKVCFDAKGKTVVGFIKQVNLKTISVLPVGEVDPHRYWRVSPGLLQVA